MLIRSLFHNLYSEAYFWNSYFGLSLPSGTSMSCSGDTEAPHLERGIRSNRLTPKAVDRLSHLVHSSTHSRNVLYQNFAFCGFSTQ